MAAASEVGATENTALEVENTALEVEGEEGIATVHAQRAGLCVAMASDKTQVLLDAFANASAESREPYQAPALERQVEGRAGHSNPHAYEGRH